MPTVSVLFYWVGDGVGGQGSGFWVRGHAVTSCGLHLEGWLRRFCQAVLHVCHLTDGFSRFL